MNELTTIKTAEPAADAADAIVSLSIARRRCVRAIYNKAEVVLAPYMLFSRHGDPHIAALTVVRDGKSPKEPKIGVFKLSGLREIQPTNRLFTPRRDLLGSVSEEHVIAQVGG